MPPQSPAIYLDHNSTTPPLPEVLAAMAECQQTVYGNPQSQHQLGRRARQLLEESREGIASILGADLSGRNPHRLIFTSGGTEANNLAIFGLTGGFTARSPGRIAISTIEHPSVARPAEVLAARGWTVDRLEVSSDGVVRLDELFRLAHGTDAPAGRPRLVSVMLANNETGVMQPIERFAAMAGGARILMHTDAAQAVGKVPLNFRTLGVSALSCAAHKFHGPRGIGALLVRGDVKLEPLLWGGFHEQGLRPGTESVALAVGMLTALQLFQREQAARLDRLTRLRDRFETALRAGFPAVVIHGAAADRLPTTTCAAFPGHDRQALVMALDLAGVACSTGSACASGSSEPSPTLLAMGLRKSLVESSLRFSLGATTTEVELDEAAARVLNVVTRQSPGSTAMSPSGHNY